MVEAEWEGGNKKGYTASSGAKGDRKEDVPLAEKIRLMNFQGIEVCLGIVRRL